MTHTDNPTLWEEEGHQVQAQSGKLSETLLQNTNLERAVDVAQWESPPSSPNITKPKATKFQEA